MKNLFSIVIALFSAYLVSAQDIYKKAYINPEAVQTVFNCGDMAAALVKEGYRQADDKDVYSLQYLSEENIVKEIAVNRGYSLFKLMTEKANSYMFYVGSQEPVIVKVNPDAKTSYNPVELPLDVNYRFGNILHVDLSAASQITIIRNYSKLGKNDQGREIIEEVGKEFITVDKQGALVNSWKEKADNDISMNIVSTFNTTNGTVYHLEYMSSSKKFYNSKLLLCNANNDKLGEYELYDSAYSLFPTDVSYENGNYVMAGFYLTGSPYTAKKTEGMFMSTLAATGAEKSQVKYDWDNLKQKLKDTKRGDFIFNGRMSIMVEKIIDNGAGYTILAESFSKGGGMTGTELILGDNNRDELVISVYDFVLFDVDYNGNLASINILNKEECNIFMEGFSKKTRAVSLARTLKNNSVFPFKEAKDGTISFINYKAKEGALAEMNMSTGAVEMGNPIDFEIPKEEVVDIDGEEMVANSKFLTKLDNLDKKVDKMDEKLDRFGDKLGYKIEKVDQVFSRWGLKEGGILYLDNGKVLSFKLDPESFAIYYVYLN